MFTWDPQKAMLNYSKHGISFEEAATIFLDAMALEWEDATHSGVELRMKRLGESSGHRILMVVYTVRRMNNGRETIRIISAR